MNMTANGNVANDLLGASDRPTKAAHVTINETALTIKPCEMANKGVFLRNDVIINECVN